MKTKITLLSFAIAAIFSSCSKESYFTSTNQSYGGYHKTEQVATTETPLIEEVALTASTNAEPAIINQTPSFSAPKTAKVETKAVAELGLEKASVMTKKEAKTVVKGAKKELKKEAKGISAEGKSQLVAALLAFFVGALGIHRFYLGYTGIGIAQLLTLGGCGIWSLIDFIRILTGDLKPRDSDYADKL